MTRNALWIAGLIGAIGGIYLATLRDGQEWGDDFSLYVAHARNLAEGRPYADTGYIYNPHNPILSPRTYPPIFPLLLVSVYLVFGMNLTAMKVFVVLLFLVLLSVLAFLLQKRLPIPYVLGCLTLFALNPYVWQQKDRLLSETPFMLFTYLAIILAEKAQEETAPRRAWFWGFLAGTAAYLAFGTRAVGVVLAPSFLVADWLRRRRLGTASVAIAAAFIVEVAAQKCLLVVESSYLDQLVFDVGLFARIALSLVRVLGDLLANGYSKTARLSLLVCLLIPASWAYLARLRESWRDWRLADSKTRDRRDANSHGLTACELFTVFNCLVLVFWPGAESNPRYLLPLLPLLFLSVAEGLRRLETSSLGRLQKPAAAALALALLLCYAGWFHRLDAGPIRHGVGSPDAVALFDWVKRKTNPRDVFLFQKPRAFALYTGRRSLAHHVADDHPRLARTLHKHGATHVVIYHASPFVSFQRSGQLVESFVSANAERFEKVYENSGFRVYRLREGSLAWR